MSPLRQWKKKGMAVFMALAMVLALIPNMAYAVEAEEVEAGTYTVDVSLSAYVSAMGGIEFGEGLMGSSAGLVVSEDGNATISLSFTTSSVTIYSVTVDTFVDATESKPGFYDDGELVQNGVTYTLSSGTALNPDNESVNYVDSMTFTASALSESYYLYIYINSNVMGVQFCDGSGSGSSNTPDVTTPYVATLTLDLDTLTSVGGEDDDSDDSDDTDDADSGDSSEDTSDDSSDTTDSTDSTDSSGSTDNTDSTDSSDSSDSTDSSDNSDSTGSSGSSGSTSGSGSSGSTSSTVSASGLSVGTYTPDASLSAYINAMGGIEFGEGLLESVDVTVNEDGTYTITVNFTTSSVSIYSLTVDTFVDASDSTPGYYDADGVKHFASYTKSSGTAENPDGEAVHYVDSMSFTVDSLQSAYYLYIYVNSAVMGVQFCDGSGSGASNQPDVETPYAAVLTIDWDSIGADTDTIETVTATASDTAAASSTSGSDSDSSDSGSSGSSSDTADSETVDADSLEPGTYYPSGSLSAYISAMGGCEFGSVYDGLMLVVNEDGTYDITVYFTTASVTIYSLTVDTFVDASDSTPGYYEDGTKKTASYTNSSGTAENPDGDQVHYVDSMTFSVDELESSYYLFIYINSSVMGVQFCDGSGSGSSNQPGVTTPYKAILTIDWSSIGLTDVSSSGSVETGDTFDMMFWMIIACAAGAGMLMLSAVNGRRRRMS